MIDINTNAAEIDSSRYFLLRYSSLVDVKPATPNPANAIGIAAHIPQKSSRNTIFISGNLINSVQHQPFGLITFPRLARHDIRALVLTIP